MKELHGHTGRILQMCMSPDGEIAASAAEDETIRLWEVFARDTSTEKKSNARKVLGNNMARQPESSALTSSLLMMQHR